MAVRNFISKVALAVHPYVSLVIPNFKAAHYTYIIFWVFLGLVLMYPVHNMRYIDVLFLSGGASTQAGLNTVDINNIKLYQQVVTYLVTMVTTPIFIHGSLLFWRLFFFERYFDGIKERLKLDFKMRRNATLAARTRTNELRSALRSDIRSELHSDMHSEVHSEVHSGLRASNRNEPLSERTTSITRINTGVDPMEKEHEPHHETSVPSSESTENNENKNENDADKNDADDENEPENDSDSEDERGSAGSPAGIRFGNLPQPRKVAVEPSDMYRSIAMLQNNHHDTRNDGDDDDVLIIKSPGEIENDAANPIYTKRLQIQFNVNKSPIKDWKRKRRRSQWLMLRKTFSNSGSPRHRRRMLALLGPLGPLDDENGDDESIDSEAGPHLDYAVTDDDSERDVGIDERMEEDYGSANGDPVDRNGRKRRFKRQLRRLTSSGMVRSFTNSRNPSNFSNLGSSFSNISLSDSESDPDSSSSPLGRTMSTNYLSWVPTVGRNSTFVHLTDEQKDELGGVEYRAVKLLIKIIVVYYVGYHLVALAMMWIWISKRPQYQEIIRAQGINPSWWAIFTAQSAFNDLGLTLTSNSMASFDRSLFVMIVMSFFIVIGNTGFPVLLRFIIWIMFKLAKPLSLYKESLGFLLDHPRRCFTLLFPSVPTWWLFFILVVLNAVDLVLFVVLDLNNKYLSSYPVGYRVMDGLFQAFSTRTAGFTVLDLSKLHSAVQVSYMLMMYISVLPLAISIRRTNVYEEQSLGVYLRDENHEDVPDDSPRNFVGAHLRNQLSFDLWFIFLGLFIICIAEGGKLDNNDYRFSVFSVLFEVISAYGTVGLSLGYTDVNTSLSGQFTSLSKLVIIAMMVRGRHRGLPYSLDRAIMLPDKQMEKRDRVQESHALRREQTLERSATADNRFTRIFTRRSSNLSNLRRRLSRSAGYEMDDLA